MPTIVELIRGTQKVLPVAFHGYDAKSIGVDQLKIVNFRGLKTKQINSQIRSSEGNKAYITSILFTGVEDPAKDKPVLGTSRAMVRCSCDSYFFYFAYPNKKAKALLGGRLKTYQRKTPPPPKGRPYKNPSNIPGLCKHLIFLSKFLQEKGITSQKTLQTHYTFKR